MGAQRHLTDLADVLRAAGLPVVEIHGWQTRHATIGGRAWFDPVGILLHHTASLGEGKGYASYLAMVGRSDLAPPLAQLNLGRDGTWYVLAAGRANHAGRCRLIAGLQPEPGRTYGDGNTQLLGIEANNDGREPWPDVQLDSWVAGVATLREHYGWPVSRVLGHKETSLAGKPDPHTIDMDAFRRAVQQWKDDPMAGFTIDDLIAAARQGALQALTLDKRFRVHDVVNTDGTPIDPAPEPKFGTLEYALWATLRDSRQARNLVLHADLSAAVHDAMAELDMATMDPDQLAGLILDKMAARMAATDTEETTP